MMIRHRTDADRRATGRVPATRRALRAGRPVAAMALILALSGCLQAPAFLDRFSFGDEAAGVTREASLVARAEGEQSSEIISTLLARRSLLAAQSSFGKVAQAALDASSRASEAELRSAKLRAQAKSKNWLPTIGPSVSLTSLGDLVAGILLEQVLFDNGHRKAERAFAAADVEVAAVNLSLDMNTRVQTALGLYIAGLRGDEKLALSQRALARMQEFERIVKGRVDGGISDMSDLRVTRARINDIREAATTAQEAATAARAELTAMVGQGFPATPGNLSLASPPPGVRHLAVLLAMAEAERSTAQAGMDRAGLLPQLAAVGNIANSGVTGALSAATKQPLGFGTPDQLKAVEASREAASRQVAEAEEDARRSHSRLAQRLQSYRRQQSETAGLARSSRETFKLFEAQFKAGQRSVMDVVSIYEQLVQREQAHVDAKYEVILIQLEMARDLGLLADGGQF